MYLNFASQPPAYLYGGSLTANDLRSEVSRDGDFFNKRSNFVECPQCDKMNADGLGVKIGDWINKGIGVYSNYQQQQLASSAITLQEQRNEEERLRLEQQKRDLEKQREKSSIIKSYGIPIAIAGGVIIIGIATYFIFKKKA